MDNQESAIADESTIPEGGKVAKSSNKAVFITFVVVLFLVFAGILYMLLGKSSKNSNNEVSTNQQIVTPSVSDSLSTTDSQLDKDTQSIDNNIKKLDSDVTSVDQGLSDTPADLSQ